MGRGARDDGNGTGSRLAYDHGKAMATSKQGQSPQRTTRAAAVNRKARAVTRTRASLTHTDGFMQMRVVGLGLCMAEGRTCRADQMTGGQAQAQAQFSYDIKQVDGILAPETIALGSRERGGVRQEISSECRLVQCRCVSTESTCACNAFVHLSDGLAKTINPPNSPAAGCHSR
jgi:hypothetical protein